MEGGDVRNKSLLLTTAAFLLVSNSSQGHLLNSGFGPFYDGLAHPFLVADDLLPVVALALLAGLRGTRCGRRVAFALPAAWLAGMVAARVVLVPSEPMWLTGLVTIILGALVAADLSLPAAVVTGLAAAAGATHGFGNGRELAAANGGLLAMAGIGCALFVVVAIVTGQVAALRSPRARIVVRVAGSWIAAIGLLMLGWALR